MVQPGCSACVATSNLLTHESTKQTTTQHIHVVVPPYRSHLLECHHLLVSNQET